MPMTISYPAVVELQGDVWKHWHEVYNAPELHKLIVDKAVRRLIKRLKAQGVTVDDF